MEVRTSNGFGWSLQLTPESQIKQLQDLASTAGLLLLLLLSTDEPATRSAGQPVTHLLKPQRICRGASNISSPLIQPCRAALQSHNDHGWGAGVSSSRHSAAIAYTSGCRRHDRAADMPRNAKWRHVAAGASSASAADGFGNE